MHGPVAALRALPGLGADWGGRYFTPCSAFGGQQASYGNSYTWGTGSPGCGAAGLAPVDVSPPVDPSCPFLCSHFLVHISPIFPPKFPVFCAFSPPRRDGSNEPQAGSQGQETAGKRTKRGELPPSFDTPGATTLSLIHI